jgi:hypothetical protein
MKKLDMLLPALVFGFAWCMFFLGWWGGMTIFVHDLGDRPIMAPETAMALMIASVGTVLVRLHYRLASRGSGVLLMGWAIWMFCERAYNIDLSFVDPPGLQLAAPNTVFALSFLAIALLDADCRAEHPAAAVAMVVVAVIAITAQLGYILGVPQLYQFSNEQPGMALSTATSLLTLTYCLAKESA